MKPSINRVWRRPIQNHMKQPIFDKWRNEAKKLTTKSTKLWFAKRTAMLLIVERLQYIKCYSWTRTRNVKSPSNLYKSNSAAGLGLDIKVELVPDVKSSLPSFLSADRIPYFWSILKILFTIITTFIHISDYCFYLYSHNSLR